MYGTGNCLQQIWHLAYRGRSNSAANYQTKYQNWFSCVKIVILYIEFQWSLFSRVQSSIKKTSISSNTNLAPPRHQGIVWTNDGLNYSHMLYSASTDCTHHGWLAVEQMSNACLCLALKKRPVCVKRRIMQLVVGNKTIFCVVAFAHETARVLVYAW